MGQIKNKKKYKLTEPKGEDYLIATQNTTGKTITISVDAIAERGSGGGNAPIKDIKFKGESLPVVDKTVELPSKLSEFENDLNVVQNVNTVQDLKQLIGKEEGEVVRLLGYYEVGDKPELLYKWKAGVFEDDGGSILNSTGGSWEALFNQEVDVRHFGAKGNGVEDDTERIQNAINKSIGNTLLISKGVYIVKPKQSRVLYIHSNTTIKGDGINSVIKIADESGDFQQVVSSYYNSTYVENITIEDIVFDNNIENNTNSTITTDINSRQFTISFRNFSNITINNVVFYGSGTNTVLLGSHENRSNKAKVTNCYFYFSKRVDQKTFDNTMLYTNCNSVFVVNNRFESNGTTDVYTAFEVHGGTAVISNNKIINVRIGLHITSDSEQYNIVNRRNNIIVESNEITNCAQGIFIWGLNNTMLKGVNIVNNIIDIKQSTYKLMYNCGIGFWRETVGDIEDVIITNNNISFEEDRGEYEVVDENKYKTTGIGINSFGNVRRVTVSNNNILNPPIAGISIGQTAYVNNVTEDVLIQNNIITNSGNVKKIQSKYSYLRAGILAFGFLKNININNNFITDNTETMVGNYPLYVSPDNKSKNVYIGGNKVTSNEGSYKQEYYNSIVNKEPRDVEKYIDSYPPNEGTYRQGEIIWNTKNNEEGEYAGYKVLSSGTYGILNEITATYTGEYDDSNERYPVIKVNNTQNIKTGDRVIIEGVKGWWDIIQVKKEKAIIWTSTTTSGEINKIPVDMDQNKISFIAPILNSFGQISSQKVFTPTFSASYSQNTTFGEATLVKKGSEVFYKLFANKTSPITVGDTVFTLQEELKPKTPELIVGYGGNGTTVIWLMADPVTGEVKIQELPTGVDVPEINAIAISGSFFIKE